MNQRALGPRDLRFDPPCLPVPRLEGALAEHWGLVGRLSALEGERDQNTSVTTEDGSRLVLKVASASEDPAVADLQCAALTHLARSDVAAMVPRVQPARSGELVVSIDSDDGPLSARLLTFVPGTTFEVSGDLSSDALVGIGAFQGRLTRAFEDFEHRAATNFMAWSLDSGMISVDQLWTELSEEGAACAEPVRERVEAAAAGLGGLRRQIVHNDGHRGNLLRLGPGHTAVVGVIDFGDIAETPAIADLAISAASFIDGHPNQQEALWSLAAGYHSAFPLTAAEVDLLVDLVLTRIVLGLLLVEFQTRHAPSHRLDEIAGELPAYRANLTRWSAVDPNATTAELHERLRPIENP